MYPRILNYAFGSGCKGIFQVCPICFGGGCRDVRPVFRLPSKEVTLEALRPTFITRDCDLRFGLFRGLPTLVSACFSVCSKFPLLSDEKLFQVVDHKFLSSYAQTKERLPRSFLSRFLGQVSSPVFPLQKAFYTIFSCGFGVLCCGCKISCFWSFFVDNRG